jgi:peptidoglycan/xylan/chitin deacetylase (PgdA/CDA1 family)
VTTINVMPGDSSIPQGGTQQFSALATDQHGSAMSGVAFTWTSSDPSAASVDANGLATGVGAGSTEISASAQAVSSNAVSLTVTAASAGGPLTITRLSPPIALVGSGDLLSLTITGTGFVPGALVNFGSNILIPTSVNPTAIMVTVPAAELTSATPANQPLLVTVTNPAPYAGTSGALPFRITRHGLVSINFDDGYQSMFDNGLPILDAAGLKSTQYIITQKVGTDSYVTRDEVLQMYNHGHEIGVHTRTHRNLTTLTEAEMTDEIAGAKQDLISWGIMPTTLAWRLQPDGGGRGAEVRDYAALGIPIWVITAPAWGSPSEDLSITTLTLLSCGARLPK